MTLLSDVEAALPDEWEWLYQTQDRLKHLGRGAVRRALEELYNLGRADRIHGFFIKKTYLYRRARLPQQRAA